LKEECKAHNLTVGGRKSDLEHRLETHYAAARATLALQSCYGRNDSASKKTEADPQRRRKEEGGAAAPALSSEQRSIPDWRVWFFIPNVIGYVRLVMTLCSFSYAFSSPVTYCILYGSSMVLGKCRLDCRLLAHPVAVLVCVCVYLARYLLFSPFSVLNLSRRLLL
jgi:hypothetical protein